MEIKPPRVVGVGFGNIFAPGQINLRPRHPKPAPETNPQQPPQPIKPSEVSTRDTMKLNVLSILVTFLKFTFLNFFTQLTSRAVTVTHSELVRHHEL